MTQLPKEFTHQAATGWSFTLRVLLALDLVAFGGLVALLIVNQLLVAQLDVYKAYDLMASGSVILDFMDDILPYLVGGIGGFLLLIFATISVWLWGQSRSRLPRYGIALVVLIFVVIVAWAFVGRSSTVVSVPMMTPTPLP